jgi:hypothetical protein
VGKIVGTLIADRDQGTDITLQGTTMHRGTLFVWLLLTVGPLVALAIVLRGAFRARQERPRWVLIALTTAFALLVWMAASYYTMLVCFEVAWALAHTRPAPQGIFPEGGTIYVLLAGYTLLGVALLVAVTKLPGHKRI